MVEVRRPTHPEIAKSPEVMVHIANFLPWSAVVPNQKLMEWVDKSGADSLEWMAVGPKVDHIPLGPTHDVLVKPVAALQHVFGEELGNGHAIFDAYTTVWNILGRRPDPIRPPQKIGLYNLAIASQSASARALQKLEIVKNGVFPVNVYKSFAGVDTREGITQPYLQTHPAFINDRRNADQLIQAVRRGAYKKITLDFHHMQEATPDGFYPFGTNESELFASIEKLHKAGVLGEVHVQPGRLIHTDDQVAPHEDLDTIFGPNPSYDTRTGRMLRFLIHDLGFMGPYTAEIDPRAIGRVFGKGKPYGLLPPLEKILEAQPYMVDYIKRA